MKVLVDFREKNSLVCSELVELGSDYEFTHLKVGDYGIGEVVVERKTISDFISSMINKRLLRQLGELRQFDKRLLIIEGVEEEELYDDSSGVSGNAVRGMLLSISLEFKCPIIFSKGQEDTARFLHLIKKRQEKKPVEVSLRAKKRNLSFEEQKQFIVEGFPNVGPVKAKQLLKKFGSISNVVNASEEELGGILKGRVEEFRKLLDN